jgi:hypothetical protein
LRVGEGIVTGVYHPDYSGYDKVANARKGAGNDCNFAVCATSSRHKNEVSNLVHFSGTIEVTNVKIM